MSTNPKPHNRFGFSESFYGPFDQPLLREELAQSTPQHVAEYNRTHNIEFHGRHFDDPEFDETVPSQPLYKAEVKQPKQDLSTLVGWLRQQSWSDFAQSLADFYDSRGYLTDKQVASAISMKTKVDARQQARAEQQHGMDTEGLDLTDLPSGLYAVPGGETRLKVRINHVTSGKWDGFTFVDDGAAYGEQQKYGMQRPDGTYRGKIEDQLRRIMEDPQAARERYAEITGRCYACNRKLEDEESVRLGIGPICRSK